MSPTEALGGGGDDLPGDGVTCRGGLRDPRRQGGEALATQRLAVDEDGDLQSAADSERGGECGAQRRRLAAAVGGARYGAQGAAGDVVGAAFVTHDVAPAIDLTAVAASVAGIADGAGAGADHGADRRPQSSPEAGDHVPDSADLRRLGEQLGQK